MSLAVFQDVSLSFGKKTIVDALDLRLADGDRVGLVGPNGSGKTSLLRMLAGEQAPDGGKIELRRGLRVGYLPQDIALEGGRQLLSFVRDSVPGRGKLDDTIAELEGQLEEAQAGAPDEAELMELATALSELHERAAHYETHYSEHEALRILAGLGFSLEDRERDLSELSGGWKMRAVLAALLFQKPDLLLLDEPTNHLDMPSVSWFSEFLLRYKGGFILICHDREFLNEQIARIVTFEPEGVRQYSGNYEAYLRQRAEEEVILENKAKNLAREREQAERFITRFRAQASKARAVQSRVKALEKLDDVVTFEKRQVMRFRFPPAARGAAEPIVLRGVGKAYGDHQVLANVDLAVRRGEKIGIIGVNGAGKTTLLRMMAGEIPVSAGSIETGHNVKVGYYAQHHAETLDPGLDVYRTVAQENTEAGMTRVRTLLGAFLFKDDDVEKKVAVLSGGERARVSLARLLINPGNLLLMDEPTNHLDLESSEALAESLTSYDGTLVFVSHNRSFVRRLATRIWDVADGTVDTYPGTLDEYMDSSRRRLGGDDPAAPPGADVAPTRAQPGPKVEARKRGSRAEEKERKRREAEARKAKTAARNLAREVAKLEAQITELEAEQRQRSDALADPEVYADASRSAELVDAFRDGQEKLESLQARWEKALSALEAEG